MSDRTWLFGLTADEWFHLACEGQDSEVAPCCGNISNLREYLQALATCQGEGEAPLMFASVLEAWEIALASHDTLAEPETFPLLHRVLTAILAEQAVREAASAEARARSRARLGHREDGGA
jgi:hypothetical protein